MKIVLDCIGGFFMGLFVLTGVAGCWGVAWVFFHGMLVLTGWGALCLGLGGLIVAALGAVQVAFIGSSYFEPLRLSQRR